MTDIPRKGLPPCQFDKRIKGISTLGCYAHRRKAQIKMMESVAILGIFFIILVIVLVFYAQYSKRSIEVSTEQQFSGSAIKVVQTLSYLPELQCAIEETIEFNCFDLYKMKGFGVVSPSEQDYYFNLFGFSSIVVRQIMPPAAPVVLYNNTPPNASRSLPSRVPVTIFDSINNRQYYLGYLEVTSYARAK